MDTYFHVLSANADKIVVVKIYAGFCRACKAFDKKYRALALEYEAAGAGIKFFDMDWMSTKDLCKSLQVKDNARCLHTCQTNLSLIWLSLLWGDSNDLHFDNPDLILLLPFFRFLSPDFVP